MARRSRRTPQARAYKHVIYPLRGYHHETGRKYSGEEVAETVLLQPGNGNQETLCGVSMYTLKVRVRRINKRGML